MLRMITVLVPLWPLVLNAASAPSGSTDAVRQKLDQAIQVHHQAVASATLSLLEEFGSTLSSIPTMAGLDKDGKLALDAHLRSECLAFLETRQLPEHPLLKRARAEFEKATSRAEKARDKAFIEAERAYESTDIELLRAVREERARLAGEHVELEPEVAANFRLRTLDGPSRPHPDDPVHKELGRSVEAFKVAVQQATQGLLKEFDQILEAIPGLAKLGREEKLALDEAIRAQRTAFAERGELPGHARLERARESFEQAIKRARKSCEAAFLAAEEAYAGTSIPLLRATRAERIDLMGRPPQEIAAGGSFKDRLAEVFHGPWRIEGEELVLTMQDDQMQHIAFGDPSWSHYDFELGLKLEGEVDSAFISVHGSAYKTACIFGVAGYKNEWRELAYWNGRHQVEARDMRRGTLAVGPWHKVRVEVRGKLVRAFLNGERILATENSSFVNGRVGLGSWNTTTVRFRDISVTSPDGTLLWSGLPMLPKK